MRQLLGHLHKENFFGLFCVAIFWILLFSDFAYTSIYHMLFSLGIVIIGILPVLYVQFKKSPHLPHMRWTAMVLFVIGYLIMSLFFIMLTKYPPSDAAFIANIAFWIVSGVVFLICATKLAFKWHSLSVLFRVTLMLAMIIILVSVLLPRFLKP